MAARRPAMRSRSARLSVMGALLVALIYTLSPRQPAAPAAASQQQKQQDQIAARELAEQESQGDVSLLGEFVAATGKPSSRPKYSISEDLRVQAIMNGSQQHGQVTKAGPLQADFWTADKRPWREAAFMRMVVRGESKPKSQRSQDIADLHRAWLAATAPTSNCWLATSAATQQLPTAHTSHHCACP